MPNNLSPSSLFPIQAVFVDDITRDFISGYFQYSANEAAERLGICMTTLKKACRRLGIKRWPHRNYQALLDLQDMVDNHPHLTPAMKHDYSQKIAQALAQFAENPKLSPKTLFGKAKVEGLRRTARYEPLPSDEEADTKDAADALMTLKTTYPLSFFKPPSPSFFSEEILASGSIYPQSPQNKSHPSPDKRFEASQPMG